MIEDKRQGDEGKHSPEPKKAHAIGEFVIVAKNGGHKMQHLAPSLVTVVMQTKNWVRAIFF